MGQSLRAAFGGFMSAREYIRRYFIFFWGLVFNALGVTFATKAELGISPITSNPYTLSLIFPALTIGNWTIIFCALLIIITWILLKKNARKIELLIQLGISFVFGYLIDFWIWLIGDLLNPPNYVVRIIFVLIGCMIVAFGAWLEVIADVAMLPGDALVRAITKVTGKKLGSVRIVYDLCMAATAAALSLIFLHGLYGVREGTVISALCTGYFIKIINKICKKLPKLMLGPYYRPDLR